MDIPLFNGRPVSVAADVAALTDYIPLRRSSEVGDARHTVISPAEFGAAISPYVTAFEILDPSKGGTGVNNGANTITTNTTVQFIGSAGVIFTTSGFSNVTLPPGVKTLVSTVGSETLSNKTLTAPIVNVVGTNATGDMYYRSADGTLVRIPIGSTTQILSVSAGVPTWAPAVSASGTVAGPTGATDNAIARYDGITGELIQSSTITISDTGVLQLPNGSLTDVAIRFPGAANTGIYSDGTNVLIALAGTNYAQTLGTFGLYCSQGISVGSTGSFSSPQIKMQGTDAWGIYADALGIGFKSNGAASWYFAIGTGHFVPTDHNVKNVGSNTIRPAVIFASGVAVAASTKIASYTLVATDNTVFFDASAGSVTATLPDVAGVIVGHEVTISKIDSSGNSVTVHSPGGTGLHTLTTRDETITLRANDIGTWRIVSTAVAGFVNEGAWTTATMYKNNNVVNHQGSSYVATSEHTSDITTEPGVGGSWATVWNVVAEKGNNGTNGSAAGLGTVYALITGNYSL